MRVGRWLDTQAQPIHEDCLLMGKLIPFIAATPGGRGCLGGVAFGETWTAPRQEWFGDGDLPRREQVAARFNLLCQRLAGIPQQERVSYDRWSNRPDQVQLAIGGARAGALIRARILRNRVRRALAPVRTPEMQEVLP